MPFTKQDIEELTSCESSDSEENMLSYKNISAQLWTSVMNLLPTLESHPGEHKKLQRCMESLLHLPMNRKTYKLANCEVFKQKYKIVKNEASRAMNLEEKDQKVLKVYNSCRSTFFAFLVAFMSLNSQSYAPYQKDTTAFEDLYQNSHFANQADYPNLFRNLSVSEIKFLSKYREMMQLALVLIPPKDNKELLKNVCAMLEGSNKKYITGGKKRATPETLRRVFLFEHYGEVKPEVRDYRKVPSPGGSSSPKRKCGSESCCSSSDDETSSVTSASSSGSASKRVRVQVKQSVEEKVVPAVAPAPFKVEKEEEEIFSTFHGWSEEDEQDFRSVIENLSLGEEDETDKLFAEVLRDERELNLDDFDTIAWC